MLYDLGKGNFISPVAAYFAIFGSLILGVLLGCVVLAVAVRIGDLIIGW